MPREGTDVDFEALLQGGDGLRVSLRWVALAPHLTNEIQISPAEQAILASLDSIRWHPRADLEERFDHASVHRLVTVGLLISDDEDALAFAIRDEKIRSTHWHPLSAISHVFTRWQGVDSYEEVEESGLRSMQDLVAKLGPPPVHVCERAIPEERIALPLAAASPLADLMQRRTTCRNFDLARPLSRQTFASMLHRVFGAQSMHALSAHAAVLKKNSPSGGGLHPTECYLLVRNVEDVSPGLYHYHCVEHALEPIGLDSETSSADLDDLALRFVAGQHWFARAHVLTILAPRFERSFWKYRAHPKAYRALILDAGHLSQSLYLAATEMGLGAFVTAAINEVEIERQFGLNVMVEGVLAVCGFGWRSELREMPEFDPLHVTWPVT